MQGLLYFIFSDNDAKRDHFAIIDDSIIKKLCPAIGPHIILKNKIKEYLTSMVSLFI